MMRTAAVSLCILNISEVCKKDGSHALFGKNTGQNNHKHVRSMHESQNTCTLRTNYQMATGVRKGVTTYKESQGRYREQSPPADWKRQSNLTGIQ